MDRKQIIKQVVFFGAVITTAVLGSVFVNIGKDWFDLLIKPSEWVPDIVIPIVWTVIYSAFAVVDFLWLKRGDIPKSTVILMAVNAVLNVLWCLVFFAFKQLLLGDIVIILNLIAGFLLIEDIYKSDKKYGIILSIYPVWLAIATTLNLAVWILN